MDRSVLIVDVLSPYDSALATRCVGARVRAIPVQGELPAVSETAGLALCVVAISGRGEAGCHASGVLGDAADVRRVLAGDQVKGAWRGAHAATRSRPPLEPS